jgi:hypothetical protein
MLEHSKHKEGDEHKMQFNIVTLHSIQLKIRFDERYKENPSTHSLQFTINVGSFSHEEHPFERLSHELQIFMTESS